MSAEAGPGPASSHPSRRKGEGQTYRNFVGGAWVTSESPRSVPNSNPADTREVLGHVPLSTAEEARAAVAAARAAFPSWRDTPAPVRGRILFQVQALMDKEKDHLARLLTREEGKTVKESMGEIQRTINILEYTAGEGRRLGGSTVPSELPHNFCYTLRQPVGVVACITPWNFPVAIPVWKIAPALVSGNTVVFKPATLTPETAAAVVSLFERAGLPRGVLNMVLGSGGTVGHALLDHDDVRAVSFTGSNEVGAEIYARGARRMIRVQAEMGGKNPVLVLADADLDLAVEATAQGAFGSTGQRCTATSRVIVEEAVADRFVEALASRAGKVKVGNGLDSSVEMGPAVDAAQFDTDMKYIAIGGGEGRLVCGGRALKDGDRSHGHFVEPTLFDHVRPSARLAQEEVFGPVVSVIRVKGFEEAMEAANGVKFGLSSSVFTGDPAKLFRFVDHIETGIVHVNSGTPGGEAQMPFGGMKGTGVGPREQGETALEFFTEVKSVYVDYTGQARKGSLY
ncbi:MAG TPA: aldehyde dehydrogenase family protein [Vicinamibacteria bacterium]|nr:aldehyde dehydrogenase family protein [Vicinamibacteria bacterium]